MGLLGKSSEISAIGTGLLSGTSIFLLLIIFYDLYPNIEVPIALTGIAISDHHLKSIFPNFKDSATSPSRISKISTNWVFSSDKSVKA